MALSKEELFKLGINVTDFLSEEDSLLDQQIKKEKDITGWRQNNTYFNSSREIWIPFPLVMEHTIDASDKIELKIVSSRMRRPHFSEKDIIESKQLYRFFMVTSLLTFSSKEDAIKFFGVANASPEISRLVSKRIINKYGKSKLEILSTIDFQGAMAFKIPSEGMVLVKCSIPPSESGLIETYTVSVMDDCNVTFSIYNAGQSKLKTLPIVLTQDAYEVYKGKIVYNFPEVLAVEKNLSSPVYNKASDLLNKNGLLFLSDEHDSTLNEETDIDLTAVLNEDKNILMVS